MIGDEILAADHARCWGHRVDVSDVDLLSDLASFVELNAKIESITRGMGYGASQVQQLVHYFE